MNSEFYADLCTIRESISRKTRGNDETFKAWAERIDTLVLATTFPSDKPNYRKEQLEFECNTTNITMLIGTNGFVVNSYASRLVTSGKVFNFTVNVRNGNMIKEYPFEQTLISKVIADIDYLCKANLNR